MFSHNVDHIHTFKEHYCTHQQSPPMHTTVNAYKQSLLINNIQQCYN